MPKAAPRVCSYAGCGQLVTDGSGRCAAHPRVKVDEHRGTAAQRGYGYRWQKASKAWLHAHPLCQCDDCDEGRKRLLAASVVDHYIPHKGDMKLFWDTSNWRSMSKACHDRKTARENGGFGNPIATAIAPPVPSVVARAATSTKGRGG